MYLKKSARFGRLIFTRSYFVSALSRSLCTRQTITVQCEYVCVLLLAIYSPLVATRLRFRNHRRSCLRTSRRRCLSFLFSFFASSFVHTSRIRERYNTRGERTPISRYIRTRQKEMEKKAMRRGKSVNTLSRSFDEL